jgi:hypothetical protein
MRTALFSPATMATLPATFGYLGGIHVVGEAAHAV